MSLHDGCFSLPHIVDRGFLNQHRHCRHAQQIKMPHFPTERHVLLQSGPMAEGMGQALALHHCVPLACACERERDLSEIVMRKATMQRLYA